LSRVSLKSRISLIVLTSSLLTILAVLAVAYQALATDFETIVTERQVQETQEIADQVNQTLELRLSALASLAPHLSDGERLHSIPSIRNSLKRHRQLQTYFPAGLIVFDGKAKAVAENIFVPGRIGTEYSDRDHFQRAIQTREPVISKPVIGRTTGLPLLSFLAPIESRKGELLGLAGGIVNLAQTSILPDLKPRDEALQSDTRFAILDANNLIYVAQGRTKTAIKPLPPPGESPLVDAALSGIATGIIRDRAGEKHLYVATRLSRLGWVFVSSVSYDRVLAPVRASFARFFAISMLVGIALAMIAYWLIRISMKPLDQVTHQIRDMANNTRDESLMLPTAGTPEIRKLTEAFNHLSAERNALNRLKNEFLATVSHELRTPITSINGSLKLLNGGVTGELPPQARQLTELALRNGERLNFLVNDLLDFSKLTSEKTEIQSKPCDLGKLMADAIEDNQSLADQSGVRLSLHMPERLWARADPQRLRQVLDNYISNALKYSPEEGQVTLAAEAISGGRTRITVIDEGEGIPEAFKDKVFQRFSQAETGTTRASKGTGLGLAICHELAARMQGEVGFYNQGGAHFWVELPASESPDNP
jgi:signal transduction histidine kinase